MPVDTGTIEDQEDEQHAITVSELLTATTAETDHPSTVPSVIRTWRFLPAFWTALFLVGLAITTIGLAKNHHAMVQGWHAVGLVALLAILIGAFRVYSLRRIFHDGLMSDRSAVIAVNIQIIALLLLVGGYDPSFAWFGLSLPYQIFGGLSRRQWALLLGLLPILIAALLPRDGSAIDAGMVWGDVLMLVSNVGIAAFILVSRNQHDQLNDAMKQLQQAHAELAASAAQGEELAVLRERARIARMMHDDLGYALVAVNIKLEAAQLLYPRDAAKGAVELEATRALIRDAMAELRHTIADLRAPVTAHDDIAAALGQLARETQGRSGIAVTCHVAPALPVLPVEAREAVWYLAREALINVERHATATRASLTLEHVSEGWLLRVADNGSGISPDALISEGHYGIVGMRERVLALSGTFTIQTGDGGGTIVEALLPANAIQEARLHG